LAQGMARGDEALVEGAAWGVEDQGFWAEHGLTQGGRLLPRV
jgi:hypothetical protein